MSRPTDRLALGTPVTFSKVLERKRVRVSTTGMFRDHEQQWLPVDREGSGFVIGYRTRANGYTQFHTEEGVSEWRTTSTVKGALVAFSLYRQPAFVPLEALSAPHSDEGTSKDGES